MYRLMYRYIVLVANSSRNDAYNVCCPHTFQFYNYLDVIYGEVRRKHDL